jgi:methyl-accepting chemotaxis protein
MKQASGELVLAVDIVSANIQDSSLAFNEMNTQAGSLLSQMESIVIVSEENSAAIEQVSASSEEMSAQVKEVTASAQSLAEIAQALAGVVAQLNLSGKSSDFNPSKGDDKQ